MGLGHKRVDLRATAQAKLDDALFLLRHQRFSNAYYLAGYSVEIGLKACIAAQIAVETIPDRAFIQKVFDHNIKALVGPAGLSTQLKEQQRQDAVFAANWAVAAEWLPDSRYETIDPTSAQALISAVADPQSGVLQWIKIYW
jgi:HEPN domain-containing protein